MWTCGIAIATQQAMLAMLSNIVNVLVESRRSTRGGGASAWLRALAPPMFARSTHSNSVIDTAQNSPSARWVERQPICCTPQLTSGGQIVPPT